MISASTLGSIRPGSGGGAATARSLGQALALRQVEDGEALQERDRLRFLAGLARPLLLVVGNEAVGIDDGGAVLALADIAAEDERLAEGQPALDREAVLDHGPPEDQHIDPGIVPAGGGVLRHGERRLRRRRAPGLDPGHAAGLQLGDDLGGDFVVEARPVGAGTSASGMSGHRGSPRRAPRASLAPSTRHENRRSTLPLDSGRVVPEWGVDETEWYRRSRHPPTGGARIRRALRLGATEGDARCPEPGDRYLPWSINQHTRRTPREYAVRLEVLPDNQRQNVTAHALQALRDFGLRPGRIADDRTISAVTEQRGSARAAGVALMREGGIAMPRNPCPCRGAGPHRVYRCSAQFDDKRPLRFRSLKWIAKSFREDGAKPRVFEFVCHQA